MAKEYLEPSEVVRLENAAENPRDRLLIHFLFRLGCRVSEALSLTVAGIDFESGRVNIVHLKSRVWMNCRQCS